MSPTRFLCLRSSDWLITFLLWKQPSVNTTLDMFDDWLVDRDSEVLNQIMVSLFLSIAFFLLSWCLSPCLHTFLSHLSFHHFQSFGIQFISLLTNSSPLPAHPFFSSSTTHYPPLSFSVTLTHSLCQRKKGRTEENERKQEKSAIITLSLHLVKKAKYLNYKPIMEGGSQQGGGNEGWSG